MTIKEAEKATGLSSRNIRFYEQKGLLAPERNRENDYREYSEADIERLKLIRALRMVDMPLEKIRQVTDGTVSLQQAAQEQYRKLQAQISKVQIAAQFCQELAETDAQDIGALLSRMDEPENLELLSNRWPEDYRQNLKTGLLALFSGLLPLITGHLMLIPIFLTLAVHNSAVLVLSLVLPGLWIALGYWFTRRGKWWLNFSLAHIFPAILCALMEWQRATAEQERISWLVEQGLAMRNNFFYFYAFHNWPQSYWSILWLLLGCFALGGLIGWLIPIFRYGWKAAYGQRKSALARIYHRINRKIPVKYIAMILLICLPFVMVIGNAIFGPLPSHVTPEGVEHRLITCETIYADVEGVTYALPGSTEFCDLFRLNEWRRLYAGFAGDDLMVEIHLSLDRTEPHAIAIYAGGNVRIYESWMTTYEGYFRIPEEVVAEILNYVTENGQIVEE